MNSPVGLSIGGVDGDLDGMQPGVDDLFPAFRAGQNAVGGDVDVLVVLRCALAAAMIFLTFLFFQFMRIKDLKSQRTILKGTFIGWSSICITLIIVTPNFIYFIILTGLASIISLLSSIGLIKEINEERNSLTEKEIYLLQKLANKK